MLAAGILLYWQLRPAPLGVIQKTDWYYDLQAGKLFVAWLESPPIEAPSGKLPDGKPAGVRAYVFSCGDCAVSEERQVLWLETFTVKPGGPSFDANGKRRPPTPPGNIASPDAGGVPLVKRPTDLDWVKNGSEEAKKMQSLPNCKDGSKPKRCSAPPLAG